MHCSKCGMQNPESSTHCVNCGGVLVNTPPEQPAGEQVVTSAAAPPKTSCLAIAAFVMGLLSLTCILWPFLVLPATICGIIALVKISRSQGRLKGKGLAAAGLVIPTVLAIVLAIVLATLRPIVHCMICDRNLTGLSSWIGVYAQDNDDVLPTENWCDLLIEEVDMSPKSFICPESDAVEGESCYAMNKNVAGMNRFELPPDIVLFFETDKGLKAGPRDTSIQIRRHYEFGAECYDSNAMVYKDRFNQYGGPEDLVLRHNQYGQLGCNIGFGDGHVKFVPEDEIPNLQWTVE